MLHSLTLNLNLTEAIITSGRFASKFSTIPAARSSSPKPTDNDGGPGKCPGLRSNYSQLRGTTEDQPVNAGETGSAPAVVVVVGAGGALNVT